MRIYSAVFLLLLITVLNAHSAMFPDAGQLTYSAIIQKSTGISDLERENIRNNFIRSCSKTIKDYKYLEIETTLRENIAKGLIKPYMLTDAAIELANDYKISWLFQLIPYKAGLKTEVTAILIDLESGKINNIAIVKSADKNSFDSCISELLYKSPGSRVIKTEDVSFVETKKAPKIARRKKLKERIADFFTIKDYQVNVTGGYDPTYSYDYGSSNAGAELLAGNILGFYAGCKWIKTTINNFDFDLPGIFIEYDLDNKDYPVYVFGRAGIMFQFYHYINGSTIQYSSAVDYLSAGLGIKFKNTDIKISCSYYYSHECFCRQSYSYFVDELLSVDITLGFRFPVNRKKKKANEISN